MAFFAAEFGAWAEAIDELRAEPWFSCLECRVEETYRANAPKVYPPRDELFTALRMTPPDRVKCVILGQDPYHEEGQAMGLSFSVHHGVAIPRSLRNIYKELEADLGIPRADHGDLTGWAAQGVLLLNDVLSVYEGAANSHKSWGWERLTAHLISVVERQSQPVAYVLWGRSAQRKADSIRLAESIHPRLVIRSNHPSPLSASRGFFGSRPFSQVNAFLESNGVAPIDWRLG